MELKKYFNSINIVEIERFVSEKQEENLFLEFKTVNHPDYIDNNREFDKKNISEVLSGFANSDGGIVIWGVSARKNSKGQDVAGDFKPIKELTKFLNTLNRIEGQAVTPIIKGIIHKKLEIGNDVGYIKTFVPPSDNAPHMANFSGKRYYKRSGDSFYPCEHFDIVDIFSRRRSPKLKIIADPRPKKIVHNANYDYRVLISIVNEGSSIAKYPYLALNITSGFQPEFYGLDGNGHSGLNRVKNNVKYKHNYSGGADIVVYPESILDVEVFHLEAPINEPVHDVIIDYLINAENSKSFKGQITINKLNLG
jgi:hypothetical protein